MSDEAHQLAKFMYKHADAARAEAIVQQILDEPEIDNATIVMAAVFLLTSIPARPTRLPGSNEMFLEAIGILLSAGIIAHERFDELN